MFSRKPRLAVVAASALAISGPTAAYGAPPASEGARAVEQSVGPAPSIPKEQVQPQAIEALVVVPDPQK